METVESNQNVFDLEAEITKTTELIQELADAEQSITQRLGPIWEESNRLRDKINSNKHRRLMEWIDDLWLEIVCIEQYPRQCFLYTPIQTEAQLSTAKLAEQVQRLKIQFRHRNKNLANERKMAKELRQCETEKQQQQVEVQAKEDNMKTNPHYVPRSLRDLRPLGNKTNIKSLIKIWAEKVQYVSSLVLCDSKNMTTRRQTRVKLEDLRATRKQLYRQLKIGEEEFRKHWDTMKGAKNFMKHIEFDLIKASRRHREGDAEAERLRERLTGILKISWELEGEQSKLSNEQFTARKYLSKVQKKQNGVAT